MGSLTGNGIDDKQIWYTENYINAGYDRNYFYFLFYLLLIYLLEILLVEILLLEMIQMNFLQFIAASENTM